MKEMATASTSMSKSSSRLNYYPELKTLKNNLPLEMWSARVVKPLQGLLMGFCSQTAKQLAYSTGSLCLLAFLMSPADMVVSCTMVRHANLSAQAWGLHGTLIVRIRARAWRNHRAFQACLIHRHIWCKRAPRLQICRGTVIVMPAECTEYGPRRQAVFYLTQAICSTFILDIRHHIQNALAAHSSSPI